MIMDNGFNNASISPLLGMLFNNRKCLIAQSIIIVRYNTGFPAARRPVHPMSIDFIGSFRTHVVT